MQAGACRVLLVTYNFPPGGGVGVQRPLAICRGLCALGHEIFVLTASHPVTHAYDTGLLQRIPRAATVFRALNPEVPYSWKSAAKRAAGLAATEAGRPAKAGNGANALRRVVDWLSFPDPQKGWTPFAIRKADGLIRRLGIDTVIVSVPPFSGLRITVELRRRFPALRLVNDFRDEWIAYTLAEHRGESGAAWLAAASAIEREAVAAADYSIAVTGSWLSMIRERNPAEGAEKFLCVPNGFEPADLPADRRRTAPHGKLLFCHAGTVDSTPVYSARKLFEAVAGLPQAVKERIAFRFAGRVEALEARFMDACGADVTRLGILPHGQALETVAGADCALLLVNTRHAHSGKIFEYMGLGKPVLALTVPGGEVDQLLASTGAGRSVDGSDVAAIRGAIAELATSPGTASLWPTPDGQAIGSYERSRLIARMAECIGIGVPPRNAATGSYLLEPFKT